MNKTIYILSQGCAANFGEGERIGQIMDRAGYQVKFGFPAEAPIGFLLNVCTVKGNQSALKLIQKAQEEYPEVPVLVVGCVLEDLLRDIKKRFQFVSASSLEHIQNVPEFLDLVFQEKQVLETVSNSKFWIKKSENLSLREQKSIGIINISQGCLNTCTFCSTRLVKGVHRSTPMLQIIDEIRFLVQDGAKEIMLTGQDTSCYGFDTGTNLAKLVQNILDQVPGDYYLRIGMGNPRHLKTYLPELLKVCEDPRVYKFIHLPIQSGSDAILKAMNRQNEVMDYLEIIEKFKAHFKKLTLSTDMIVGFPGETESDFEQSLKLLQLIRPSICNITRFVARPGTKAYNMEPKIPKSVQVRRSSALFNEFEKIAQENNEEWIGWEGDIIIEKQGYRKGTSIGRNFAYRPVALLGDYPAGQKIKVTIESAEAFALIAKPIE